LGKLQSEFAGVATGQNVRLINNPDSKDPDVQISRTWFFKDSFDFLYF
jgi:hypothetical protein